VCGEWVGGRTGLGIASVPRVVWL